MYPPFKKKIFKEVDPIPEDCFIKKTNNYVWIFGMLVIGMFIYMVMEFTTLNTVNALKPKSGTTASFIQNVNYTPCPYCDGFLDSQGRCNVSDCPVYSPDWGKAQPAAAGNISPAPQGSINANQENVTLIKELSAGVVSIVGGGAFIHSIFNGGNAQNAGLQKGDIITKFNGYPIKNVQQLQQILAVSNPAFNIPIEFVRDGVLYSTMISLNF